MKPKDESRQKDVQHDGGALADCPHSPNCVSSQASRERQRVAPIAFDGGAEAARERLIRVLTELPRVTVVYCQDRCIRAEAHSPLFRFVDDLTFLIDEDARVIHVRSASRKGYFDFGANRRRVESIRRAFARR